MNIMKIRNPRAGEISDLQSIWVSVFGSIGLDVFFRLLYDPELCVVAEVEGSPAAMGFIIPSGEVVFADENRNDTDPVKCAMIYSVATIPKFRGMGLGTSVVNGLIDIAFKHDFTAVVLCPSDDGLFCYYSERTGLRDRFFVKEKTFRRENIGNATDIPVKLSAYEYYLIREKLLKNITHIKQDLYAIEYQSLLCSELGGGLYRIGDSCAVVERQSDHLVWIKELLAPGVIEKNLADDTAISDVVASLAVEFHADEYLVRSPAETGEGRRFGMIMLSESSFFERKSTFFEPWYGVAFD